MAARDTGGAPAHKFIGDSFGLLRADGTDEPLMLARSVLVDYRVIRTGQGASKLIAKFERLGRIWSPGSMLQIKGRPYGTRLVLPGPAWWLNGVPDAPLECAPIAVEAQDVERPVALEPLVESPDESLVGRAVQGTTGLGRMAAAGRDADRVGGRANATNGKPGSGEPRSVGPAVDCSRPGHAGSHWRLASGGRWNCAICHPPASGLDVIFTDGTAA